MDTCTRPWGEEFTKKYNLKKYKYGYNAKKVTFYCDTDYCHMCPYFLTERLICPATDNGYNRGLRRQLIIAGLIEP